MLDIEPHVGGVRALLVPSTGITDYTAVTAKYAEIAAGRGAEVKTGAGVVGFDVSGNGVVVRTRAGEFSARYVVNCAGLYSDRLARMAGDDPGMMLVHPPPCAPSDRYTAPRNSPHTAPKIPPPAFAPPRHSPKHRIPQPQRPS